MRSKNFVETTPTMSQEEDSFTDHVTDYDDNTNTGNITTTTMTTTLCTSHDYVTITTTVGVVVMNLEDDKDDDNDNDTTTTTTMTSSSYFNNAGQAILSEQVRQIGIECIEWNSSLPLVASKKPPVPATPDCNSVVRQLFSKLIHVEQQPPDNVVTTTTTTVAIMPCTSFAISFAAMNIERDLRRQTQYGSNNCNSDSSSNNSGRTKKKKRKGRILLLQDQMDSAVYPWENMIHNLQNDNLWDLQLEIIPYPTSSSATSTVTTTDNTTTTTTTEQKKGTQSVSSSTCCCTTWTESIITALHTHDVDHNPFVVVCLPPLHWSDGSGIDLIQIGPVCQSLQIPCIIDATQGVGAIPTPNLNVQMIQPTMLCSSTHKWLRGPSGCCLVYMNPVVYESWIPLDQHGRNRFCSISNKNWDAYQYNMKPSPPDHGGGGKGSGGYDETFVLDGRKFDSGGKPNPILLPMIQSSLEELIRMDTCNTIQPYLQRIMKPFFEYINISKAHIFRPLSHPIQQDQQQQQHQQNNQIQNQNHHSDDPSTIDPYYYHIIGIRPIHNDILSIEQLITIVNQLQNQYNITTAVRCGAIRISPYLDTTSDDVRNLIEKFDIVLNNVMSLKREQEKIK